MRKKWLLLSLLAIVLLPFILTAAVLVYIGTADLSQHRDLIAEHISKITGRRLSISGEFELNIDSTTSLIVSDISLANAAWADDPEMLSIRRVEAEIEIWPLLQGDIHVPRFHLEGVKALLETDASGQGNWVMLESADTVASEDTEAAAGFKPPWIGDLYIGDVELAYRDANTDREIITVLDHVTIKAETPASPVAFDLVAEVDSYPVEASGLFALPALLKADELDVPVELRARVLDLEAEGRGRFSGSTQAPAIDLSLEAKADSLQQMRQVFGELVPEVKPVSIVMQVKADQGQPVSLVLNATAGKASLEADLNLRREQPRPNLTGTVTVSDVDIARLWAPLFDSKPVEAAVEQTGKASTEAPVRLDQPLDLAILDSLDANVTLSVKRTRLPQIEITSLYSRLIIDDRQLSIDETKLVTDAGTVSTNLMLAARSRPTTARLDLRTSVVTLGKIAPLADNQRFEHGSAQAELSVSSAGETAAALIEGLQGVVKLEYTDQKRKEKLTFELARKPEQMAADRTRLLVTADGYLKEQVIELRGHVVPPAGLLKSHKPYDISLALKAFGVTGKVTGTAAAPYALDGLDLALQARAENLKGLQQAFGTGIPDIGQFDLSARFKAEQSKLHLSAVRIELGQGHVEGGLVLDNTSTIPDLKAELTFVDLDLDELQAKLNPPAETKKSTDVDAKRDKVFPDQPLPFETLSRARIDASLRARNVEHNNRRLREAEIRITMAGNKLSASLLKLSSIKGELVGNFVVDASGKGAPAVAFTFKAPHIDMAELLTVDNGKAAVEGPMAVDISLEGKGHSVAQIMATLNGNVNLLMEQGSADAKALDMFVGGLSAMFGTIFSEDASKTRIECAICDLKFEQGVLTPQLAVLDTQYSTVIAEGQVDLKQEQLNLRVSPQAKGVTLSVAFPVIVKGTLSNPNVDIEKTGALLKAGELWATVVYPPAALVKFSDLGGGQQNPCVTMVAEKAGIPIIEDVGKAVKGVVKGTGAAVKGVGSGLGKLLGKEKGGDVGAREADDADAKESADIDKDDATNDELDDPDLFMDY